MSEPEAVEPEPTEEPATAAGAPITHANQLRGARFKELMKKPGYWISILVISLVAGGIFGALGAPAIGGAVFVIVALLGVLVVFFIADSQAEDAFYDSYCASRGLTRSASPDIGELTPLLRKGDKRNTDEVFSGTLDGDVEGSVVLYTYTEVSRDSDGDETETDYPFTMIHVEMPEITEHLAELRVQNKSGFKFLEGFEDKFRGDHERVTLESEAMRDRYEIFVLKEQDPVWVRRLFSPTFIVWLTEAPPAKFAFELENGSFIAFLPDHMDDVEGLDRVIQFGTYVVRRLREEVAGTTSKVAGELS